jgi:hypothetical protein
MIAYDLQCANSHRFEGWFEDHKAYIAQKKKGLIACPVCNDTAVSRLPSTFAIKSSPPARLTDNPPGDDQLARLGRKLSDYIKKNFDDVGCEFAKEALKIHYGAIEPRNIRGVSTQAEEKMLREEGVTFFKFPVQEQPDSEPNGKDS